MGQQVINPLPKFLSGLLFIDLDNNCGICFPAFAWRAIGDTSAEVYSMSEPSLHRGRSWKRQRHSVTSHTMIMMLMLWVTFYYILHALFFPLPAKRVAERVSPK